MTDVSYKHKKKKKGKLTDSQKKFFFEIKDAIFLFHKIHQTDVQNQFFIIPSKLFPLCILVSRKHNTGLLTKKSNVLLTTPGVQ